MKEFPGLVRELNESALAAFLTEQYEVAAENLKKAEQLLEVFSLS